MPCYIISVFDGKGKMVGLEDLHEGPHSRNSPRSKVETELRKRQEREEHDRCLEAAYRMIEVFNRNASTFIKNRIVYCLDRESPPFAPTICLFKKNKSQKPEILFIPVIIGDPHGTFSLRSLSKRTKRETFKWVANHSKYYEEYQTRLADDPEEAAREIIGRLTAQSLEFNSLWDFDRTMGACVRRYFARRRAVQGLTFVAAIAAAAISLIWISRVGLQ
jgi:hypothetical protein